jgi:EAL domain-containing protein (putative c-di-GMP-specific phosphodiesterase class I)
MGSISPAEFVPIAEEINMINEIGIWVMEHAISQSKIWNDSYSTDLKIGINVSPKQLDHKTFIRDLTDLIAKYSISPKYIDIEITENIAMDGEIRIQQIDSLFRGLGISISVDDFGTGYSSLSYLKFFPFERIKIAKPLIDAIAIDDYDLQIVKSVILLAKSIGMKTIAEGVETQEQYNILEELGCDEVQGYLLGKPVSSEQFKKLYLE